MEPSQVVVEVFGGHAAPGAQEGLDPLMQAVDGLDVQFAATRSPADWFKTSWEIFIPVAQHAKAVPPSVTSRASLLRTGSSTALMASALSTGRTALTTAPLRSAATRIGTCSCDRPRFVALPPRPRASRSGASAPGRPCSARSQAREPL